MLSRRQLLATGLVAGLPLLLTAADGPTAQVTVVEILAGDRLRVANSDGSERVLRLGWFVCPDDAAARERLAAVVPAGSRLRLAAGPGSHSGGSLVERLDTNLATGADHAHDVLEALLRRGAGAYDLRDGPLPSARHLRLVRAQALARALEQGAWASHGAQLAAIADTPDYPGQRSSATTLSWSEGRLTAADGQRLALAWCRGETAWGSHVALAAALEDRPEWRLWTPPNAAAALVVPLERPAADGDRWLEATSLVENLLASGRAVYHRAHGDAPPILHRRWRRVQREAVLATTGAWGEHQPAMSAAARVMPWGTMLKTWKCPMCDTRMPWYADECDECGYVEEADWQAERPLSSLDAAWP